VKSRRPPAVDVDPSERLDAPLDGCDADDVQRFFGDASEQACGGGRGELEERSTG
jgi:hypothetical protein